MAFISNHGYLDNPTFRGMRWHLTQTFDHIDIIDLHGNAKKKESAPDGSKDENVFDIMQGVSIIIATKLKDGSKEKCNVRVADLYGKRKNKFDVLNSDAQEFVDIELDKKMYYFVDKNIEGKEEYDEGFSVVNLFLENSVGIVTSADSILIGDTAGLLNKQLEEAKTSTLKKKTIQKLKTHEIDLSNIQKVSYRPFDDRFLYYSADVVERSREKTMKHFVDGVNIGLTICRQIKTGDTFKHALVNKSMTESAYVSNRTSEIGSTFPLYLYDDQGNRSSNLDQNIVKDIKAKAPKASDETIFDYIYGVLHSPTYRDKYKEFLKIDFPRVPFPQDQKEFDRYAMLGAQLRELHLMTSSESEKIITTYPIAGNNIVEKPKFVTTDQSETGKVYINETQYFGGVPKIAWEFYIGGYQPAQKWLKDRKGRELSAQDLEHYQRIITVLTQTDTLMKQIG